MVFIHYVIFEYFSEGNSVLDAYFSSDSEEYSFMLGCLLDDSTVSVIKVGRLEYEFTRLCK